MHPHLQTDSKQAVCADLINKLEQCHGKGFWTRLTGECNGLKTELNMCLRKERLARIANNNEKGKERRQKTEAIWKEIDENN